MTSDPKTPRIPPAGEVLTAETAGWLVAGDRLQRNGMICRHAGVCADDDGPHGLTGTEISTDTFYHNAPFNRFTFVSRPQEAPAPTEGEATGDGALKAVVERVAALAEMKADDAAPLDAFLRRNATFGDLRTLLAALSSQASVMEEMARGLETSNANHEKFERLWYLEKDKVDRLKLAICGGEDAPGAIDAVSVEDCEGFIAEERSRHIDTEARLEYVRQSRDGAADRAHLLYTALVDVRGSVETYPLDDSETCMCGSPVEGHNVGSGHAPVSQADHAISLIVEAIDKALGIAAIPDDALIGAGRPDDYEGPDVGMHDTEIVEPEE